MGFTALDVQSADNARLTDMSNTLNHEDMLRVGTVLHDTYRIDDFLSSGGFGNTYVATNIQFGERCAIKEFFLKGMTERDGNNTTVSVSNKTNVPTFEAQKEKFKKEAVRLRKLSSDHIVRFTTSLKRMGRPTM